VSLLEWTSLWHFQTYTIIIFVWCSSAAEIYWRQLNQTGDIMKDIQQWWSRVLPGLILWKTTSRSRQLPRLDSHIWRDALWISSGLVQRRLHVGIHSLRALSKTHLCKLHLKCQFYLLNIHTKLWRERGWSAWTAERKSDESYCHSSCDKIRMSFGASFLILPLLCSRRVLV